MAIRVDAEARRIELSVGDLLPAEESDPFAPAHGFIARMIAGLHAHVEHHRDSAAADASYRAEVFLATELEVDGWTVRLSGRADGLRREGEETVIEELKSVVLAEALFERVGAERYPGYVLQLRLYLYLLACAGESARGLLVLVNLPEGRKRALDIDFDLATMRDWVEERVRDLLDEWDREARRLAARRALAPGLGFPFPARRLHQQEMEESCFESFEQGGCLLVTAPPGLGKTAAALSAALRHALAHDRRVFFATAKTTEQRIVASTLGEWSRRHPGLSAVVLRAKAKICTNEVVFCHAEFCEFARDWPAKMMAHRPREALLEQGLILPDAVRAVALDVRVCPFELELDLAARADVVVGDYNYVFDPVVSIRRNFEEAPADDLVLVIDEAHNLVERAREYYSPALDSRPVSELLELVAGRPGEVYRGLEAWLLALSRLFGRLEREAEEAPEADRLRDAANGRVSVRAARHADLIAERRDELEAVLVAYFALRRDSGSVDPEDPVLAFAFEFLRFARVAELEGEEFVYLWEPRADGSALYRILCLDPSRPIGRRLASFHAVVAMSATLEPSTYYRDLLGFPRDRTASIVVPSPFPTENREVLVVPTVETTFRERSRWYDRVADTLREVYESHPGHWAAYFPSFAYLAQIEARLGRLPGELLVQAADMKDDERASVLSRLERPDGIPRLLLAALGGAFAEGVDLPGEALVGIVVVSPGLPQLSLDRELVRGFLDQRYGRGFEYAYLVPGMSRVVQAAGRLLRSERDRGVVVLLDRRFAEPAYQRLLPREWGAPPQQTRDPAVQVREFFDPPRH